jgi:chaperonin cofactor prefoldin
MGSTVRHEHLQCLRAMIVTSGCVVGRCFIQQDKEGMTKELEESTTKYQAQIKKTKDTQKYYERQRDETSGNLQEMLENLKRMSGM